jgi:hypothetical protein
MRKRALHLPQAVTFGRVMEVYSAVRVSYVDLAGGELR